MHLNALPLLVPPPALRVVMVMVIRLGLYRSLPCYLGSSFGPARRVLRRASNAGKEKPSLARPHFAGSYRDYGMVLFQGGTIPAKLLSKE